MHPLITSHLSPLTRWIPEPGGSGYAASTLRGLQVTQRNCRLDVLLRVCTQLSLFPRIDRGLQSRLKFSHHTAAVIIVLPQPLAPVLEIVCFIRIVPHLDGSRIQLGDGLNLAKSNLVFHILFSQRLGLRSRRSDRYALRE